jgi:hypothetical protein
VLRLQGNKELGDPIGERGRGSDFSPMSLACDSFHNQGSDRFLTPQTEPAMVDPARPHGSDPILRRDHPVHVLPHIECHDSGSRLMPAQNSTALIPRGSPSTNRSMPLEEGATKLPLQPGVRYPEVRQADATTRGMCPKINVFRRIRAMPLVENGAVPGTRRGIRVSVRQPLPPL